MYKLQLWLYYKQKKSCETTNADLDRSISSIKLGKTIWWKNSCSQKPHERQYFSIKGNYNQPKLTILNERWVLCIIKHLGLLSFFHSWLLGSAFKYLNIYCGGVRSKTHNAKQKNTEREAANQRMTSEGLNPGRDCMKPCHVELHFSLKAHRAAAPAWSLQGKRNNIKH